MEWCPSMGAFAALYLYAGLVCTFLVYDGEESAAELLLSVCLWPFAGLYAAWRGHDDK
jgi:hypothetical protein